MYFAREERAIAETGKKYGGYCRSIAFNILRSHEDTEECVSDTWLHTWDAIPPARPGCLRAFVGRITRNLSFTRWEAARAQKRGGGQTEILLSELAVIRPPGGERVDARLDAQAVTLTIEAYLRTQTRENRQLFVPPVLLRRLRPALIRPVRPDGKHGQVPAVPPARGTARRAFEGGDRGMTTKDLFRCIGNLSDGMIEEAADIRRKPRWRPIAALAACAVLAISIPLAVRSASSTKSASTADTSAAETPAALRKRLRKQTAPSGPPRARANRRPAAAGTTATRSRRAFSATEIGGLRLGMTEERKSRPCMTGPIPSATAAPWNAATGCRKICWFYNTSGQRRRPGTTRH